MSKPKTDRTETYTYEDYLTWDGSERWELIDGVPYLMASPTAEHQEISLALEFALQTQMRDSECRLYHASMDLRFDETVFTKNTVQPDIFIMCGEYKRGVSVVGVPKLIIEILSPSTAAHDLIRKLHLYQRAGVQEYWVVNPEEKNINVYLHDGTILRWTEQEYKSSDKLSPSMFPDLVIDVSAIFA